MERPENRAPKQLACCKLKKHQNRCPDACQPLPSRLLCRPRQRRCLTFTKVHAAATTPVGEAGHHATKDIALASHAPRLHARDMCPRIGTPNPPNPLPPCVGGVPGSAGHSSRQKPLQRQGCRARDTAVSPTPILGRFSTHQGNQDIRCVQGPWAPLSALQLDPRSRWVP